jgi:hypothetical protein
MELTWFDFAGQDIFWSTHQFFLTDQCVYLIVFRLNDKDYVDTVNYWMQNVSSFIGGGARGSAKIVLIGTHLDAVGAGFDLNAVWKTLDEKCEDHSRNHIVAKFAISCKTV